MPGLCPEPQRRRATHHHHHHQQLNVDLIFPNTFVDLPQLNVEFNGGGILIFPNTFVDLPN